MPSSRATNEEVVALTIRASDGDEAAQRQLVESHLWLTLSLARRYSGRGIPIEDLLQEGNETLVHLVRRPQLAEKNFTPYASAAIKQHLRAVLACRSGVVTIPSWLMFPAHDERRNGWKRPGRPRFVPLADIRHLAASEPTQDEDAPPPERFRAAWAQLTEHERTILGLRYGHYLHAHVGLGDDVGLSRKKVAEKLGVSSATVGTITTYALRKLERALTGETLKKERVRHFARLTAEQQRELSCRRWSKVTPEQRKIEGDRLRAMARAASAVRWSRFRGTRQGRPSVHSGCLTMQG
jgi:RNA polymerase sigma factor (sigma-70 family)